MACYADTTHVSFYDDNKKAETTGYMRLSEQCNIATQHLAAIGTHLETLSLHLVRM